MARKKRNPGTIKLGPPTKINGSQDTTLTSSMERKYESFELVHASNGQVAVTIHNVSDPDAVVNVGNSFRDFMYALANGALSGQGQGPDGSCIYVRDGQEVVEDVMGEGFWEAYRLRLTPAGRSGAKAYEGSLAGFLNVALAKAGLIEDSVERHGTSKVQTRTRTESEPDPVEITL